MSSHSNTPWNNNLDFLFDVETTGLPGKNFLVRRYEHGRLQLPPIQEVVEAFQSHVLLQFGYSKSGSQTKHINIIETSTGYMPQEVLNNVRDISAVFKGNKVPAKVGTVRRHSMEDIFAYLQKSGKLDEKQISYYMGNIAPHVSASSIDTMYQMDIGNGEQLYTSRFSKQRFLEKTDAELAKEVQGYGFADGKTFFQKTLKAFSGKDEKDGLYSLIDDILKMSESGTKQSMGSWGAMYDVNFIRYMLHQSGHMDLLDRFEQAVSTGSLQMQSVEREWQLTVWKLVQENPDLADSFKIGYHPEAFVETGGRFGKVAQTFEEFQYSTLKWNTDALSRYFSWNDKIKSLSAAHHAGADVDLEKAILEQIEEIKAETFKLAESAGLKFASFEEFARSKTDRKFMEEAISNVMKKHMSGKVSKNALSSVDLLKAVVSQEAKNTAAFQAQRFPAYVAGKLATETGVKLVKYGGIGAAVGILALSTYSFFKKEDSTDSGSDFKVGQKQKLGSSLYKQYTEGSEGANLAGGFYSKVVAGAMIPASALYVAGLLHAKGAPKLFGVNAKTPTNMKELIVDMARTTYTGLKLLEANVPLARAFKASALVEYYTGNKRVGVRVNSKGQEFYKGVSIPIMKKGEMLDFEATSKLGSLLEAARITNPNEAQELSDFLRPRYASDVDKATLRISKTKDNKTILFFDEYDKNGGIVPRGKKSVVLDLEGHVGSTRIKNMLQRPIAKSAAMYTKEFGDITNPLVIHKYTEDRVARGMGKIPFSDYMLNKERPDFAMGKGPLRSIWEGLQRVKYELDLVPKGVGEGRNELRPQLAEELHKAKNIWINKHLKGDAKWSAEGLEMAKSFYMDHPLDEMLMHGMNTFLETPFEMIGAEKALGNLADKALKSKNQLANVFGKGLKFMERPNLGLDTAGMTHGLPEYLLKFGIKRLLPAWAVWQGVGALDHLAGWATFSPTGSGPMKTALSAIPHAISATYSKISDIFGLTNVAKRQDRVAPGSTGIGIFAPAASLSSIYLMGEYAHRYGPQSTRELMDKGIKRFAEVPFVQKAMRQEAWNGALRDRGPAERLFSWAIKNPKMALFGLGLVPTIPFMPGFFGSNKSYAERRAEYKGEKEVAIRKSRGWLLSSSPFHGENVIQYRRHAQNLFRTGWEDKIVWGGYRSKLFHNLTAGLFDRYKLEREHALDQPVYQSAGYGASIPLIGPIIAATIGKIIKPTRTYHLPHEGLRQQQHNPEMDRIDGTAPGAIEYARAYIGLTNNNVSLVDQLSSGYIKDGTIAAPGINIPMQSEGSISQNFHSFKQSFAELAGFKGFMATTIQGMITGKKTSDEFIPYAQDAGQMYNPAQGLWAYKFGDPTLIGGEFIRRIFQNPNQKWEVNEIPNEMAGVSWIPHSDKYGKDFSHGTTFDQVPMGWLYASKKGFEQLFPTMKDVSLENYPDPIRLEILKGLSPNSPGLNVTADRVLSMAMSNQLDPYQEQRYYNTMNQVRNLKEKVYAHAANYKYSVPTEAMSGKVTELDLDASEFTVTDDGEARRYRLAGVSTNLADIRSRLLKQHVFETAEELDENARKIQANLHKIITDEIEVGGQLDFKAAGEGSFSGLDQINEAIVGSLNNTLIKAGASLANTGNLGSFNIAQKDAGLVARGMAKYWDMLTKQETFWDKKLISDRDYLNNYLTTQVYNKEVKLWSRPIEHLLKPAIASTLRHFGIDKVPSFTVKRRQTQQYWDVIKYMKYKMLAVKARDDGDTAKAGHYHTMWRRTMVGANPLDHVDRDEMMAMPASERAYFKFFANEPDPKKRAKIFKYLPAAEKRLLEGIWTRELARTSGDKNVQEAAKRLTESEGWKLSDSEREQYKKETGGRMTMGDWARARFVEKFAENHALPGMDWEGWAENVNIENVEIEAIKQDGEQTEDYGFFENRVRQAAFDSPAFQAALDLSSIGSTASDVTGMMIPYMAENDGMESAYSMPTTSNYPIVSTNVSTNGYMKAIEQNYDEYASLIPEKMYQPRSHLNGW